MSCEDSIKSFYSQIKEFAGLFLEDGKLFLVESVSLLLGEFFALMLIAVFILLALFFILLSVVWLLSLYMGFPLAALVVALLLLSLCVLVYIVRRQLFVNVVVGRLCAVLFTQNGKDNEK